MGKSLSGNQNNFKKEGEEEKKFEKIEKINIDDIFKYEEKSVLNLQKLLRTKVGFNTSKDPWNKDILKINPQTGFPVWVFKNQWNYNFYQDYPCMDKLILQVQRNNYNKYGQEYKCIEIGGGYIADLELQVQFQINDSHRQRQIIFINDKNKDLIVERPNNSSRFNSNPFQFRGEDEDMDNQKEDLKNKVVKIDLGTEYFKVNDKIYPSMKQIFQGLMKEMRQVLRNPKLKQSSQQLQNAIKIHTQAWKFIFDCYGLDVENEEKIKKPDIRNPNSNFTKAFLFIYSMETFVYKNLNVAERNKDYSKVETLGPFACILREITRWAQTERQQNWNPDSVVYRGTQLPKSVLQKYLEQQQQKKKLVLDSYTSTSLDEATAHSFMFRQLNKDDVSVLFKISNLDENGFDYFKLDCQEYAMFPNEDEVLLVTGTPFKILDISEKQNEIGFKYYLVELEYSGL